MTKNTENYIVLDFKSRKSTGTFFLGIVGYFLLPLVLMGNVAENDNYSLKTLQAVDNRIGRKIELDREEYVPDGQNGTVKTFSGERLYLVAENLPAAPAVVSLRGTFINNDTIRVDDLHINQSRFRDGASIVGLSMLMLMWLSALIKGRKAIPRNIR